MTGKIKKYNKKMLTWTVVAASAAVAGVVWALVVFAFDNDATAPSQSQSGSQGTTINGDNNSVANYQLFQQQLPDNPSDQQIRDAARRFASEPPKPPGPYAYIVVGVGSDGLIVRTTGGKSGRQIGTAVQETAVWVDCRSDTGFDPGAGDTEGGSVWLRIRWPSVKETTAFLKSQPSDPSVGWIYSGYVVPAGHNGQVPTC